MTVKLTPKVAVPHAWADLGLSVALGVIVGAIAGATISEAIAPLVAWDTIVITYVVTTWLQVLKFSPELVKKHAVREDPSRVVADIILITASVVSLAAVAVLLVAAKQVSGAPQFGLALLGVFSVVASWLMIHTTYALKYAETYYTSPEGGIDFGYHEPPIYVDFAYLAFTIGMTYQVSDTSLKIREFRSMALKQALLSFMLGTVIIATTINLIAGLGK